MTVFQRLTMHHFVQRNSHNLQLATDRLDERDREIIRRVLAGHAFRNIAKDLNFRPEEFDTIYKHALAGVRQHLNAIENEE